ncbi:MAG: hypothetical protein ACE5I1_21735, partial [bacterium]
SVYGYDLTTKRWRGPPQRNLSLHSPVHAVAANDAAVWAGTDRGVFKFNRKTKDWRRFKMSDGLIDLRVNAILIDGDYIWFGTPEGVTAFYWNDPGRVD